MKGYKILIGAAIAGSLMMQIGCAATGKTKDEPSMSSNNKARLASVAAEQSDELKVRYMYRHPVETLSFFGIKPGDTVVEALPGGGWYSKILVPYLGDKGRLIGVDYSLDMWPSFGGFATPEFIEGRKAWPEQWPSEASAWSANGAKVSAFTFTTMPDGLEGQVDTVLFIRALHNLARFEQGGGFLSQALAEAHRVLKPGGTVGIVQHAMSEDVPDSWTQGDRGYLKKSFLVKVMNDAGFDLVAESDINKNPKDKPKEGDNVWRLPPSLQTDEANKATNLVVGESNRVTLLFKKR